MSSQSTERRDPVTAAFAAWSETLAKPWPGGFGWPAMPFAGAQLGGPGAAFGALLDFQRQALRGMIDFAALPLTALGSAVAPAPSAKRAPAAKAAEPPLPAPAPTATVVPLAPRAAAPVAPAPSSPPASTAAADKPAPKAKAAAEPAVAAPKVVQLAPPTVVEAPAPAAAPAPEAKAAKPAPAEKPAARKAKAAPALPAIDPAGDFDDNLVEKVQPPVLAAPDGAADELVAIKGIGPKLAKLLNELGIHHYRQIGAWTPGEIAWVNAKIDFKGRVQRDKWVSQARALTKG